MSELNCTNCCISSFKEELCDCDGEFCTRFKGIGNCDDFINKIMQTKDVRENVHGCWTEDCECSVCGEHQICESNFCPNCGASMLKGEEDDVFKKD